MAATVAAAAAVLGAVRGELRVPMGIAASPKVTRPSCGLFGGGGERKKSAKELREEEQFRRQQEILERRRDKSLSAERRQKVDERRAEVTRYMNDKEYRKQVDDEKRARREADKPADPAAKLWNIIIPQAPFGLPDYDGGERFDLQLPYVDEGYVDESDTAGKESILGKLGSLFGGNKKKNVDKDNKDNKK